MHRCLDIPEVSRWILSYLSDHQGTLAAVATTCRALRDPALDALWYSVKGLSPLLNVMPDDLWLSAPDMWPTPVGRGVYLTRVTLIRLKQLQRCITKQDIALFKSISSRIRNISICDMIDYAALEVLSDIHLAIPKENYPIFPNLKAIHIRSRSIFTQAKLHCLQLFLSGSILHINLDFRCVYDASSCIATLSALTCGCSDISSLTMRLPGLSKVPVEFVSSMSQHHWQSLRHLALDTPSQGALIAFSHLPRLQSLVVNHATDEIVTEVGKASSGGFRNVRILELSSNTLSACYNVVQLLKQSPLKELKVRATELCHPLVLRSFNRLIEEHIQYHTLRILSVTTEDSYTMQDVFLRYADNVAGNDPFRLEALCPFVNLLELSLTSPLPHARYMSPGSVLNLVHRTPQLRSLRLGSFGDALEEVEPYLPRISLDYLTIIARALPMLKHLSLSVDASATQLPRARPSHRFQHQSLTSLSVGYSSIVSARNVAAFLSTIFPNLTCITASRTRLVEDDFFARWEEVAALMDMLRTFEDWEKQRRE